MRQCNFSESALIAYAFAAVGCQQCLCSVCVPCHHIHCSRAHSTSVALTTRPFVRSRAIPHSNSPRVVCTVISMRVPSLHTHKFEAAGANNIYDQCVCVMCHHIHCSHAHSTSVALTTRPFARSRTIPHSNSPRVVSHARVYQIQTWRPSGSQPQWLPWLCCAISRCMSA